MRLIDYFARPGAKTTNELAIAIGVRQPAQVRQWTHGYAGRLPSPSYCVLIERETGGAVTRRDLRPDDWWRIWPELVDDEHPVPAVEARDAA